MVFTKRLREGVRRGEICCGVRMWTRPHVTVGKRYRMEEGAIEVDSIKPIGLPDITPELARESGFLGVVDLLKVANHGRGRNIYLIRFHYVRPRIKRTTMSKRAPEGSLVAKRSAVLARLRTVWPNQGRKLAGLRRFLRSRQTATTRMLPAL
jgi:hypothetical protein